MSGIRTVLETFDIPLDPKKKFTSDLPQHLLDQEPRRDVAIEMWNTPVRQAIKTACRARKSRAINSQVKKVVFQSAMEKICTDFNRRTGNRKMEFRQHIEYNRSNGKQKAAYNLHFMRLSDVTESVTNVRQYCTAEIPERLQEAEAELVGNVDSEVTGSSALPIVVPVVEIIAESEPHASYNYYDGDDVYPQSTTIVPVTAEASSSFPSPSAPLEAHEVVAEATESSSNAATDAHPIVVQLATIID